MPMSHDKALFIAETGTLEEGVDAYIKELETPGVVSYSHFTLRKLYNRFGEAEVAATFQGAINENHK